MSTEDLEKDGTLDQEGASPSESDYLNMSDEEIEKLDFPSEDQEETITEDEDTGENEKDAGDDTENNIEDLDEQDTDEDDEPADETDNTSDEGKPDESDTDEDLTNEDDESAEKPDKDDAEKDGDPVDDSEAKAEESETDAVDYKTEYNKILAPFRANGRDIQIKSVDDAITLMKMGANYNKKMAGLKPAMKIVKMLENNDLLDEGKLTYLIDLDKKNPDAVAKFVKESGVDSLAVQNEDTNYEPGTYTVEDSEVELDQVLGEIQESPAFQETVDIISNKWDDSSKKVVLAEPGIIKVINAQVENGIYKQIMDVVESERLVGRLTELSDLDAYKAVGNAIKEQGGFTKQDASNEDTTETPDAEKPTKPKAEKDPKLNDKRRAAGSPRSNSGKSEKAPAFDPLGLSDEDFEKAAASYTM